MILTNHPSITQHLRTFSTNAHGENATLATLRGFLFIMFIFAVPGAGAELLLLEHPGDFKQWIPLALMSLSLIVLGWYIAARGPMSMRVFQVTMLLFAISRILAFATALSLAFALGVANTLNAQVGKNQGALNPNLAGEKELLALPHLNAKLVKDILDKRPFLNMTARDTLLRQSLSKEQLAELYPKLFVPINLNTATREEILLVPGVGRRMAHEFEKYRPYRALAQFRREIGKYVDKKEVARLERYLTLE
jgi:DNA uptake protein ComE-like DNA-binding protein